MTAVGWGTIEFSIGGTGSRVALRQAVEAHKRFGDGYLPLMTRQLDLWRRCFQLEILPCGKSLPDSFADREIVTTPKSAVKDRLGLLDIGQSLRAEDILVGKDPKDFSDKDRVQPKLVMLEKPAFQGKWQFTGQRRVHALALERGEAGLTKLVMLASRDQTNVIRHLNVFSRGNPYRECFAVQDVMVGERGFAQRNRQARWIAAANAAPGGVHEVRLSIFAIRAYQQHGVGVQDGAGLQRDFLQRVTSRFLRILPHG